MKKKIIAILCVAVMTFGLTGCGNKGVFNLNHPFIIAKIRFLIAKMENVKFAFWKV